nr:YwqG family protein [uncultured Capnocytophaga sp.]
MLPTQEQIQQLIAHLNATTQREVIRISLSLADNLALTDSKFGGLPYIPQGGSLPTSAEGKPLFMLAQINCEQLPENNLYPKKGLLQFWIADTEAPLYGLDYDDPCSNDFKRVLYYPTIGEALPIDELHFR